MNKYAFIFLFGILLGIFVIYFYLELFTGRSELESGEHDSAGTHKRGQNSSTIFIFRNLLMQIQLHMIGWNVNHLLLTSYMYLPSH